jgi:hypothetical protein
VPQSIEIAALVVGAGFLLLALTGADLKAFGIDIDIAEAKLSWRGRVFLGFVGLGLIIFGVVSPMFSLDSGTNSPDQSNRSETALRAKVKDYYEAVDKEDWDYTYEELDSQAKSMFTREEWHRKNQWYADNEDLELAAPVIVQVNDEPSSNDVVSVTVIRTFKDDYEITRHTFFVYQDGEWKHRFSQEEKEIFMPFASYKEFTEAQQ